MFSLPNRIAVSNFLMNIYPLLRPCNICDSKRLSFTCALGYYLLGSLGIVYNCLWKKAIEQGSNCFLLKYFYKSSKKSWMWQIVWSLRPSSLIFLSTLTCGYCEMKINKKRKKKTMGCNKMLKIQKKKTNLRSIVKQ